MTQGVLEVFEPAPPAPPPERECEGCGKHLVGHFEVNINHGMMPRDRRGLGAECTAMHLTLNHVQYQLLTIADQREAPRKCHRHNGSGVPNTVAHRVEDLIDHYLPRMLQAWPTARHEQALTWVWALARYLGASERIEAVSA